MPTFPVQITVGSLIGNRKICRLEEIACEFSDVGYKQRFNREKQEEQKLWKI